MADFEQVMMTLGRNIFWARTRRKMIQEELANVSKLPRSTISHLESGKGNPSLDNLAKISEALNISIDELITSPKHPVWGTSRYSPTVKTYHFGKVKVFDLLPDQLKSIKINRIEIKSTGRLKGKQHPKLSREFVSVIEGELVVFIEDESPMTLRAGESSHFRCDRKYYYENKTDESASAITTVLQVALLG